METTGSIVHGSSFRRVLGLVSVGLTTVALSFAASTAHADLRYVRTPTKALPDGDHGSAKATCPSGTHVLGGGQYVFSGLNDATLDTSTPFDGDDRGRAPDDGWKSTVRSFSASNTLTVFAVCAGSEPSYAKEVIHVGGLQSFTGRTTCQRGRVMGGGARLPVSFEDDAWLESSSPFDGNDADAQPDNGWTATGGVGERNLDMTVTAICGSGTLKYSADRGTAPAMSFGEAAADCPGESRIVGGGTEAIGVAFHPITISSPYDDGDPNNKPDDGWQGEFDNYSSSDPGLITAFAICKV